MFRGQVQVRTLCRRGCASFSTSSAVSGSGRGSFRPHVGVPPSYVLTTYRSFPSLEPVRFQPVASDILGLPVRRDILWQAVVFERDAARVGSRHVVNKAEMDYSTRKLRPQKGSGRARLGARGNPMLENGGRAFGRKPGFDWSTDLPSQAYSLAMRTALSHQYKEGRLFVVDGEADFVTSHSQAGEEFMAKHGFKNHNVTVIVDEFRQNLHEATKDKYGKKVEIIAKEGVDVRDILKPTRLIIEAKALQWLAITFGEKSPIRAVSPQPVEELELHQ